MGPERAPARSLWRLERRVLLGIADRHPNSAAALRAQVAGLRVVGFENTGAGFFAALRAADGAPPLAERSPLDGGHAAVAGVPHGMGFLLFLDGARAALLEGFCNGDADTGALDFERVAFAMLDGRPGGVSSLPARP